MPGFDGTGPFGDGRPGRGLGPCARFDGVPVRCGYGFGRGRGFGGGFGFRRRGRAFAGANSANYSYREPVYSYSKEDLLVQKSELEKQLQWLDEQLSKEENT